MRWNPKESDLSQQIVRHLFDYDPETGIFIRKSTGREPGWLTQLGYRVISIGSRGRFQAHRLAWLWHYGYWPPNVIDHINHLPADNRIANLRLATRTQNQQNMSLRVDNTSGIAGVWWDQHRNLWVSYIRVNKRRKHLGRFKSFDEAVRVRLEAERRDFGKFAPRAA